MADGDSGWVRHGDAPLAVRAAGRRGGQVAGQRRVERTQAVGLPGPLGEAEQGGQRDREVDRGWQRGDRPAGRVTRPPAVRAAAITVARTATAWTARTGSGTARTAVRGAFA